MSSALTFALAYLLTILNIINISNGETGKFFYFGYGSNLLKQRILINNPTAVFYDIALLQDYRLDFNMTVARWNGAVATIVPDPGEIVIGALWLINNSDMKNLDRQEGVDEGWYYPKNITVTTRNGSRIDARVYVETYDPPKVYELPQERQPSKTYLEVIVIGAQDLGMPNYYVRFLKSFKHNGKLAKQALLDQLGCPFNVRGL